MLRISQVLSKTILNQEKEALNSLLAGAGIEQLPQELTLDILRTCQETIPPGATSSASTFKFFEGDGQFTVRKDKLQGGSIILSLSYRPDMPLATKAAIAHKVDYDD